ncbi:MAG: RDD family protein [Burkholderiales bacterium]|jgi:uncharacterized RDD family membrane protein YckC
MSALPLAPGGSSIVPAGAWRRFMCAGYEGLILFGVVIFFGYAFSAVTRFEGHLPQTAGLRLAFQVYLLVVVGAYFSWFWSRGRRTLAMKTLGVRLVDHTGAALSPARAMARYVVALICIALPLGLAKGIGIIGLLLLPIPFMLALVLPSRNTLYDLIAGTRLIIDDPRPPANKPADR